MKRLICLLYLKLAEFAVFVVLFQAHFNH
jgi:hypothetical protein